MCHGIRSLLILFQISDEGRGVAGISNMLTISRIHNALSSAAAMRRYVVQSSPATPAESQDCFGFWERSEGIGWRIGILHLLNAKHIVKHIVKS